MRALEVAARRWPDEPRSKLLLRLVEAGSAALRDERAEVADSRLRAIEATSGRYADAFPDDYLAELRRDWAE